MTIIELFTEIFGEDVFVGPKTQGRADKRTGAYTYMKKAMGMRLYEISDEVGRNHSSISVGIKRFKGLLETGDPLAVEIWRNIDERANAILEHKDGEILTIDREVASIS